MFLRLKLAKEDKGNLVTLLVIGLILRLYAFSQIYLISQDGAFQYIPVARLFYNGDYLQALLQPQLPLYPFLISLFSHITGDFELAGQLISIIFSILAVFPLYFIGKSLFGPKPAFWTTVFYLINPLMLRSSVDVLKEGVFIFFFFYSVYCSLWFLREGKRRWLIWTAVFAIVGALTRMIALEVLLVLGLWLVYVGLQERLREKRLAYRYLFVVILVLGVIMAFVIPGIWGWEFWMTKKPYTAAERIFRSWFVYQWPSLSHIGERSLYIVGRFIEKAHPLPFLIALFGLGWRMKAKELSPEERYLALLMVVLIIIFFPLLYASGRYLLPAIFVLYLWAGFGFVKMREFIDNRFTRYPRLNAIIPVIVLLLAILPLSFKPQRLDKIGRKEVGIWLREQSLSPSLILTNIPRVAYYAEGDYLFIDNFNI
ncbi:MAG: glycosyltransferase family 39 protein, partial [Deltaproteobacteria bacterium]|nr:glycosyltransferase family 39 protein [Deltaproteobacteria bacterium]